MTHHQNVSTKSSDAIKLLVTHRAVRIFTGVITQIANSKKLFTEKIRQRRRYKKYVEWKKDVYKRSIPFRIPLVVQVPVGYDHSQPRHHINLPTSVTDGVEHPVKTDHEYEEVVATRFFRGDSRSNPTKGNFLLISDKGRIAHINNCMDIKPLHS